MIRIAIVILDELSALIRRGCDRIDEVADRLERRAELEREGMTLGVSPETKARLARAVAEHREQEWYREASAAYQPLFQSTPYERAKS